MRIPIDGNDQHLRRDVITLPLRIGACAIRLGFRAAGQAATVALKATERLAEAAVPPPGNVLAVRSTERCPAASRPTSESRRRPMRRHRPRYGRPRLRRRRRRRFRGARLTGGAVDATHSATDARG